MLNETLPAIATPVGGSEVRLIPTLVAISKLAQCLMSLKLAGMGLRKGQDEVLLALPDYGPQSLSDLASKLDASLATTRKLIGPMADAGLVTQSEGPIEARTLFSLSQLGKSRRADIVAIHAQLEADLAKAAIGSTPMNAAALHRTEALLRRLVRRIV
jgi:DNA-binding MarR family transcriptional regulator